MKLVILPLALGELQDAAAFYSASANAELGLAFVAEFDRAVSRILANPQVGAVFRGTRRRYVLRRFPYSIFYQVAPDEIWVVAVAHQRRRPSYWAGRKQISATRPQPDAQPGGQPDAGRRSSSWRASRRRRLPFSLGLVQTPTIRETHV